MGEFKEMTSVVSDRVYYKYTELAAQHESDGDFPVFEKAEYVSSQPNTFNPDKNDWIFKVDGKEHVLNSCGHLNYQMGQIPVGSLVTPIYKGKKVLEDGQMKGKPAHQFDVKFAAPIEPKEFKPAQDVAEEDMPF